MEQEIIEMKNIVKNELTVQHDTIICDPYLSRVYYKIKYNYMVKSDSVRLSKCF